MDRVNLILVLLILFSCNKEEDISCLQEEKLLEYYNNINKKLTIVDLDSVFNDKYCIVLKFEVLDNDIFFGTIMNTYSYGIRVDPIKFDLYEDISGGYSTYLELIMLVEVGHALGDTTKPSRFIPFAVHHTEEEMQEQYKIAEKIYSKLI